jgi:hypothetical protein
LFSLGELSTIVFATATGVVAEATTLEAFDT